MVITFKQRKRERQKQQNRYENNLHRYNLYKYSIINKKPPIVRSIPKAVREIMEKIEKRYSISELRNNPMKIFRDVSYMVKRTIISRKYKSLVVLSPYLYERFVREFIEFIKELKKTVPNLEVVVITRPVKYVKNEEEHISSIELLKEAGIHVCYPTRNAEKFHAKAIVIGNDYVIAGSINYLAPTHDDLIIETRLVKLLKNRTSARTLLRIFKSPQCQ